MHRAEEVLHQLRAIKLDDHEAVEALRSALMVSGSRSTDPRVHQLTRGDELVCTAKFSREGRLLSLSVPSSLWPAAKATIAEDMQTNVIRVARSALFTHRPLEAAYTVPDWLQIRPVATALQDRTRIGALTKQIPSGVPFPFVFEVLYRWSSLPFLEGHRRITAVQHAKWLLASFIDVPVFELPSAYAWAFIDTAYALVECGVPTGLDDAPDTTFSDVSAYPSLVPVPTEEYINALGIRSSHLRVPDLHSLYGKFTALEDSRRLRFLRCGASIFASNSPTIRRPQRLVSLVSAIEPLLEVGTRCPAYNSTTGIAASFRAFLDTYVQPPPPIRRLYEAVYSSRSKMVHGGWNPDVDEPFFSLFSLDPTDGLAAWAAARQGAIRWLLAQQ